MYLRKIFMNGWNLPLDFQAELRYFMQEIFFYNNQEDECYDKSRF